MIYGLGLGTLDIIVFNC